MIKLILYFTIALALIILLLFFNLIYSRYKAEKLFKKIHFNENPAVIDGIKINYEKKGCGSPVLLIHGFLTSLDFLREVIDNLSQSNTVYAIDIIGFGMSSKEPALDYSKKNMAKIAREFMLSMGISRFNVLGHSLGGEIALNMAYYFPENINRLILVSSAGYIKNIRPFYIIEKSRGLFNLFVSYFFTTYFIMVLMFKFSLYNKKFYNQKMMNYVFLHSQSIPVETLYKMSIQNNDTEAGSIPKAIYCPALIIWGKNDKVVPLKYGKRLHDNLKNSKLIIYDKCGHVPFLERRDEFLKDVRNFLCMQ